jgi:Zn-dependent hydrolases, including glyoxylases
MKSKFLIYYCLFLFSFLPLELTGQSLELHTINVGHGDATLIILRHTDSLRLRLQRKHFSVPTDPIFLLDSVMKHKISLHKTVQKAVLIDAGVGDKQGNKIVAYMGKMGIAIGDSLEAIILTHNHKDHYGGFKMLNTGGNYKYAKIYYRGNTKPVADGPAFKNYFENVFSGKLTPVDVISTEISLGKVDTTSIVLTAVSSNGYVYKSRPKGDQINGNNQNDYGCSWILQYGAFRYFVGGDLSGENINSYKDVETPLVDSLVKYDKAQFAVYSDATKTLRKAIFVLLRSTTMVANIVPIPGFSTT